MLFPTLHEVVGGVDHYYHVDICNAIENSTESRWQSSSVRLGRGPAQDIPFGLILWYIVKKIPTL